MTFDQTAILVILAATMTLFIANYWRYDIVAGLALLAAVFTGLVPPEHAFDGFGHPAVITVCAVLVLSKALQESGFIDILVRLLDRARSNLTLQILANGGITAGFSGLMNNIGALALMLPVAIRDAQKAGRSASLILIPLSFASLLGGLVTLIGTPPNIIIATFRADALGEPFAMLDFTPVGLPVAVAGIFYLGFVGWRLLPRRDLQGSLESESEQIYNYIAEAKILEGSELAGLTVGQLEEMFDGEVSVMSIIDNDKQHLAPDVNAVMNVGEILILEGDPKALEPLYSSPEMKLKIGAVEIDLQTLQSNDVVLMEAIVMPNSSIEGWSMRGLRMHERYDVNLLAMSRMGSAPIARLKNVRFRAGDVLLLQGSKDRISETLQTLGCLAISNRPLTSKKLRKRFLLLTPAVFGGAIVASSVGLLPIQISFSAAVLILIISRAISLQQAYDSLELPIIVLLGCLIPVGHTLQTSGATELIASNISSFAQAQPLWMILALIMIASMLLSDLVHNTPTAVLMAPIALEISQQLGFSADAFLMAVAIGSASPYLTPIGHPSNTLVMGPGGYDFKDYWRVGLPLDVIILFVSIPLIILIWS